VAQADEEEGAKKLWMGDLLPHPDDMERESSPQLGRSLDVDVATPDQPRATPYGRTMARHGANPRLFTSRFATVVRP
jgi:hypothetical protein